MGCSPSQSAPKHSTQSPLQCLETPPPLPPLTLLSAGLFLSHLSPLTAASVVDTLSQRCHQRHWWRLPVVGLFWRWLRTGSVWCGGRSWSLTEAPPAATWLPLKWLFRFGKFSGDNLEHVSSKCVSEAGKVVEGFIAQPVYFPFSSPELCFARKANLMHLIVPQVQPGVQEVLDWSSVEWLWK